MAAKKSSKPRRASAKPAGRPQSQWSDAELERLYDFGPIFDDAKMEKIEASAAAHERRVQRRLALSVCARDAQMLSDLSRTEPLVYGELRAAIEAFAAHASAMADVARAAAFRVGIADCRDDAPLPR